MLKTILPESNVDQYNSNTNVTFNLSMEGEQLVRRSIFLTGTLTVTPPTANANAAYQIDKFAGIHNFFDNWVCGSEKKGAMNVLNNYGRYVRHHHISNMSLDNLGINKDGNLMYFTDDANLFMSGAGGSQDFCFKPYIQINQSNADLSYDKFGNLSVQFYLVDRTQCLVLVDNALNAAGFGYSISNLKLHYQTVPDQKSQLPVLFDTYHSSAPIDCMSSTVTISKNVSGMFVDGVQGSFILKNNDKTLNYSAVAFDDIGLTSIQFAFNDFTNTYLQFTLDKSHEILYNAINAFNLNNMQQYAYNAQEFVERNNTMIGLKYPYQLDMSKNKFSCTIQNTLAQVGNKYSCYLFFHGMSIIK